MGGRDIARNHEGLELMDHAGEIDTGQRFEFGANWQLFLQSIDERRIEEAQASLQAMLGITDLAGKTFLDAGSGSGLFSLAARRLGATVHSFDYDPQSVACAAELKNRYFPNDPGWRIEEGSVLDQAYLEKLGGFDVVYSWGVLHHTGEMWQAIENTQRAVSPGGLFFIAIYNDQGKTSNRWKAVKRAYCRLPRGLKFLVLWPAFLRLWGPTIVKDLLRGRPFKSWRSYGSERGMKPWRDVVDWVGGLPFEVAKPEEIFSFAKDRGFELTTLKTCGGGLGCNEFVFRR